MYKKIKRLISMVLIISSFTVFYKLNENKAESLTPAAKTLTTNLNNIQDSNKKSYSSNEIINTNEKIQAQEGYFKVAENEKLELYLERKSLGLKIRNKNTGYVWSSVLDKKDSSLNRIWQAFADSAITLEYLDEKGKIRQISITSENAQTKVNLKDAGFVADINFDKKGIRLSVDVTLNEDSISVKVPFSSIEEKNDNYKIQAIYIYPFLGSTKENEVSGYIFIPDGCGALISLNEKTIATQPFIGKVYGKDYGISGIDNSIKNEIIPPEQIYMPVFGVVHGDNNAFIASIESGDPYSEILAYPAGVTTTYNWVAAKFNYRYTYFQPIDKKGNGINVNQKDKNQFDILIKYMFLSDRNADYVGMAKRYQKELIDRGILKKLIKEDSSDIPVRLEFFASENKKLFLWKSIISMTTVSQMNSIIDDLLMNKVKNISITVRGWSKGGITGASPNHFPFESKVGTADEWVNFINKYKDKGIPIYMYTDYIKAYANSKGYSKKDIAIAITSKLMSVNNNYFYLNPNATASIFNKEQKKFDKYGINNIAVDNIGKNLISAYNHNNTVNRIETIKIYENMFSNNKRIYSFYSPNQYLWKYTNQYLNIPMYSSKYMLETETVPFLQIVLKGYVDYFAPPSNFNANSVDEVLRMIDYGAYPSFYLTNEDPVKLIDTESNWLYTSQYLVWKNEIIKEYMIINKALKDVKNATLEDRKIITDGVVVNTYSNGISIIINYTDKTYNYNNVLMSAKDFAVVRGK